MKDRIKKFYHDHENAIVLGGIVVTGMAASFVVSYKTVTNGLSELRVERVDLDKSGERVRITYKNGDQDYYHAQPIQV